jgi:hypothetical protein
MKPPSKEEIKEQLKRKPFRTSDYQKEYNRNRTEAIAEILQENVRNTTVITNEKYLKNFESGKRGRR